MGLSRSGRARRRQSLGKFGGAKAVCASHGRKASQLPCPGFLSWADISKAKRLLDWSPQTLHEEGIRRTVDWYNQNREWASELETG